MSEVQIDRGPGQRSRTMVFATRKVVRMTRFQKYRAEAFDKLVEKWHRQNPEKYYFKTEFEKYYFETELLARAEFIARMKLAKESKKSSRQTSLF